MVSESVWREQVIDAVQCLAESGVEFTVDDVRELVSEDDPGNLTWCSIWSWPEVRPLQARVPGRGEISRRPQSKGHPLSVRRGRPEIRAVAA